MPKVLVSVLDPLHIFRSLFIIPAALLGFHNLREHERNNLNDADPDDPSTRSETPSARDIALKTTFITFAAAILIWVSIFMYITFYYTYMPAIEHVRPVFIQFELAPI